MTAPRILFWDIETTPNLAYVWGLWDQNVAIGQLRESTEMHCFGARWYGESKVTFRSTYSDSKQGMLDELWRLLDEADALVSWNGRGFDSKHARREFLEAGMPPPSPWTEIDLMVAVKNKFRFPSNKLQYVSERLGVGSKTPHTGFQMWLDSMAGDKKAWALMKKYQVQDVNLLVDLYNKLLPWLPPSMVLNKPLYEGEGFGCPRCGSTEVQRRGYLRLTGGVYQRLWCSDCKGWSKDPKRLATTELRPL